MKIAIFHELPPGGARRAMNEFSQQLKKRNTVDLFIVDEKRIKGEEKFYNSVYFYSFLPKRWFGNNWRIRIYKDTIELMKLYKLHSQIANTIDKGNYDVVLVSASKYIEAPFIMRFLKTPFAYYIHDPYYRLVYDSLLKINKNLDFWRYNYERMNRIVRKYLDRKNVAAAYVCLSPSHYIARKFAKTYKKRNTVVRYGVDSNFFKPSKLKKIYDILYVGSYHPIDGYDLLKKALKLTKKKLSIRLIMTDREWISDDLLLKKIYQQTKLLICTARKEGLGMVAVEAMACGVPVVAVDEAGHRETVVRNSTGILIERKPKSLINEISRLLRDQNLREKMGTSARDHVVKNWSWNVQAAKLECILLKLTQNVNR